MLPPCHPYTHTHTLQIDPPSDWETYIHRSGRTGRAGHAGTCITLVTRKMEYMVPIIEVRVV